jgi:NAD(P)-dependent dehydrogenase (short-subunit alcohol dehydrogenase family)
MQELQGKTALVTGAGAGIGRASAIRFARAGANVALLDIDAPSLEPVASECEAHGVETIALEVDVSDPGAVRKAVDRAAAKWKRMDAVYANAGINGVWAPIYELAPEEFQKIVAVNLFGSFYTIQAAEPHMRERGGAVLITSSVNGTRIFSNTGATAYSAAKAGQAAMGQMLALELASERIRVNVICPGAIKTDIGQSTEARDLNRAAEPVVYPEGKVPLTDGKPGTPEHVADLALFLVSDASAHISGTLVYIDGAESLLMG